MQLCNLIYHEKYQNQEKKSSNTQLQFIILYWFGFFFMTFYQSIFKCQFLLHTYSKEMHIYTGFLKINMPIQNTKRLIKSYPKKITTLKFFFPHHMNFRSQMS